jgi:ArsR family transcriptional regulator
VNIPTEAYIKIYKCLCDLTRLRILGLLLDGPLCVCHIQSILKIPQAKVSRQLTLMKKNGLLESTRENNWSIYRIASRPTPVLVSNLKCLQDARGETQSFKRDQENRQRVIERLLKKGKCFPTAMNDCCGPGKDLAVGAPASRKSNVTKKCL